MEFASGVLGSEPPVNGGSYRVPLRHAGVDCSIEAVLISVAAPQASPGQHTTSPSESPAGVASAPGSQPTTGARSRGANPGGARRSGTDFGSKQTTGRRGS